MKNITHFYDEVKGTTKISPSLSSRNVKEKTWQSVEKSLKRFTVFGKKDISKLTQMVFIKT